MGKNRRARNRKRLKKAIRRNKKWIILGAAVLGAAILLLLTSLLLRGCSGKQKAGMENETEISSEEMVPEGTLSGEEALTETVELPAESVNLLSKNAIPEVNELVARYYTALQGGDGNTIVELRDNTDAKELLRMQLNGEYIEAYKNLACYTKNGLTADSYVVFAYYEVKFAGHETLLPGITPLYICRNEAGEFYLHDLTIADEISSYVGTIAADEDVAELYAEVGNEYQNILAQNEALNAFVTEYAVKMKETIGTALEEEGQSESAENEADSSETQGEPVPAADGSVPDSGRFTVGDTLNVRRSPDENAERIGVCYEGETIEILEKQEDGWTKVKFNGETGYIKTSVLK